MRPIYRILWLAILTGHATAAIAWWWIEPAGFAFSDPHFWANEVAPWVILGCAIAARISLAPRPALSAALMLAFPVGWLAASLAARVIYPITFEVLWIGPALVGLAMLALGILSTRPAMRWRSPLPFVMTLVAITLGLRALSQRAAPPTTLPLNSAMPDDELPEPLSQQTIRLSGDVQVQPGAALINITSGRYTLGVQPVLDFSSRSPDRCWVLFAPRYFREGPRRRLAGILQQNAMLDLSYTSDTRSFLRVTTDAPGVTRIESFTKLFAPTWSHLNTFCELSVAGHRRLSVVFSPCPQLPIEVTTMEYPRGRPERLAYLDEAGGFHVVEASSAEKGPYHELARGKLLRSEPIAMTLLDEDRPIFRVTLDGWAAQASVAPSPTAGYGLPQNAIEFSLQGASPSSLAGFYITLAATSAGRGYDSVGHGPGTYGNRMVVRALESRN